MENGILEQGAYAGVDQWMKRGIESEMKTLLDMPFTTMEPDNVLEPMRAVKGKNLDD